MRFGFISFENSFYGILEIAVRHSNINCFVYRVLVSKDFTRDIFRKYNTVGLIESRQRITIFKVVGKNLEKVEST